MREREIERERVCGFPTSKVEQVNVQLQIFFFFFNLLRDSPNAQLSLLLIAFSLSDQIWLSCYVLRSASSRCEKAFCIASEEQFTEKHNSSNTFFFLIYFLGFHCWPLFVQFELRVIRPYFNYYMVLPFFG